jgi:PTH1 family peptidyl-tRNA hydrolase
MGLFYKKETANDHAPLYTLGSQKTVLIVGLGNIGKEYDNTRHNVGFAVVNAFAQQQDFPAWVEKKDLKCFVTRQLIGDTSVLLIKPTTYMNESGQAMFAVQNFYKIPCSATLVVHDELDLPFGQIKTKQGGGSAGNNGVKSVIQHCGEDFARIRIGIKNELAEKMDSANFVLAKFRSEEQRQLPKVIQEVSSMLSEYTATSQLPPDTRRIG